MAKYLVVPTFSFLLTLSTISMIEVNHVMHKGKLNEVYSNKTDRTTSHVYKYFFSSEELKSGAPRIYVSSKEAKENFPIHVVVSNQREIFSLKIPMVVESDHHYFAVNRTVCPTAISAGDKNNTLFYTNVIQISTSSPVSLSFTIELYIQQNFHLKLNRTYESLVNPSSPIYFQYNFSHEADVILLKVDSPETFCAKVSVQNFKCPVYDLEYSVQFEGMHLTMDTTSAIAISKDDFPHGVNVVFIVASNDAACVKMSSFSSITRGSNRIKKMRFSLTQTTSHDQYLFAIASVFLTYMLAYAIFIFCLCIKCFCFRQADVSQSTVLVADVPILPSERVEIVSDDESTHNDENFETKSSFFVSDFCRQSPLVLSKKTNLFNWNLMTVSIFYALPVIQLMLTYQIIANKTGNHDVCYYNFLCAHPLGVLTDFNHVYSNIGYVLLGLLFIILIRKRDILYHERLLREPMHDRLYGIPQHFGLFYAMGVALVMEGIMSACYHVCPNHTNIQFDTTYMYTMSILIMIKIYQTRHPDLNANAYTVFATLAFIIFIGVIGVVQETIYFWSLFASFHLLLVFLLSIKIYYFGRCKFDRGCFKRLLVFLKTNYQSLTVGDFKALKPIHTPRMLIIILINIVNWTLAIYSINSHYENYDFDMYLVGVFICNVLLCTLFYIVMKFCHGERILWQTLIYMLFAVLTWFGAAYFFLNKSVTWTTTPAISRHYNQPCKLLNYYDNHDIWHFLSSLSLFSAFMILLTLDDDLAYVKRDKINVF